MANNVSSALDSLLINGLTFYAPFSDKGNGEVSLVASGAGASQAATFTRATPATTVNSAGLIVPVASGVARSYYDPTTLQYRGYLAEGARENLALRSAEFENASWSKVGAGTASAPSVTANFGVSPDGGTNADRVQFALNGGTTTADRSLLQQSITLVTSTTYAFSVWIRSLSGTLSMGIGCDAVAGSIPITVTESWQRFSLTGTATGTAGLAYIHLRGGQTPTQSNSADVLIWGAQLEAGTFPSTYIPTEGSAVTRNADVLTYPAAGNALNTGGTLYCEAGPSPGANINSGYLLSVGSTGNNSYEIFNVNGAFRALIFSGGANQGSANPVAWANGTSGKGAATFGTDIIQQAWNGTAATADTSATVPVSVSNIRIGCNANGLAQPFMPIRNVRIFNRQFTAAQLQAITA